MIKQITTQQISTIQQYRISIAFDYQMHHLNNPNDSYFVDLIKKSDLFDDIPRNLPEAGGLYQFKWRNLQLYKDNFELPRNTKDSGFLCEAICCF